MRHSFKFFVLFNAIFCPALRGNQIEDSSASYYAEKKRSKLHKKNHAELIVAVGILLIVVACLVLLKAEADKKAIKKKHKAVDC